MVWIVCLLASLLSTSGKRGAKSLLTCLHCPNQTQSLTQFAPPPAGSQLFLGASTHFWPLGQAITRNPPHDLSLTQIPGRSHVIPQSVLEGSSMHTYLVGHVVPLKPLQGLCVVVVGREVEVQFGIG